MRCQIFKRFPRTGIPDEFESVEQLERFVSTLVKTGCIDNGKKLWWDVRPHYMYDTVEVRICDMPTNMDHTIAVVALIQALMAKLYLMYRRNTAWRTYSRALIEENKWRAIRYGTEAKLIDFGMQQERPLHELIEELIEFVKETTDIFGTGNHMNVVREIVKGGTSAHRQVEIFDRANGDVRPVCDWLMAETMRGI
jgi:glutamate---cysteine ligase / carboxylate-amine ligase